MSDFGAGPRAGGPRNGPGPDAGSYLPPVLLALLAIAMLIGGTLGFLLMVKGGGQRGLPATPAAVTTDDDELVVLTVAFAGDGDGTITISPGDKTCSESCEHRVEPGTRLTVTRDAASDSRFAGWEQACDGRDECTFIIGQDRTLRATFKAKKPETPVCGNDPADDELGCAEPLPDAALTAADCDDGKDNDGDGLTDREQDPECLDGENESGKRASARAPTPPADECADGRDNDSDGLTDAAQDPNCASGTSETGAPTGAPTGGASASSSDCSDGRDNDGDGLIDTAQDPGCEADRSEVDGD